MTNKISYQSNSSRLTFGRLAQNQAKAMDETNSTTLFYFFQKIIIRHSNLTLILTEEISMQGNGSVEME